MFADSKFHEPVKENLLPQLRGFSELRREDKYKRNAANEDHQANVGRGIPEKESSKRLGSFKSLLYFIQCFHLFPINFSFLQDLGLEVIGLYQDHLMIDLSLQSVFTFSNYGMKNSG